MREKANLKFLSFLNIVPYLARLEALPRLLQSDCSLMHLAGAHVTLRISKFTTDMFVLDKILHIS